MARAACGTLADLLVRGASRGTGLHLSQLGSVSGIHTPSLRLGVTGLSRSGKTVFITSLVRNLAGNASRLPFFSARAEQRLVSAFLQPQPDDAVPRFDYEGHLACLKSDPPQWPASTRHISELRVALTFKPDRRLRWLGSTAGLNLDIVDYPGEWLLDLALLDQSYDVWAERALQAARRLARLEATSRFLAFADSAAASTATAAEETVAIEGAALFRAHLVAARNAGSGIATLGPGRFLLPGELEGTPLVTFFPIDRKGTASRRGSLGAMVERRYESYRTQAVKPFFRDHFSRLDRQIVLVDVLSALNGGADSIASLEEGLSGALGAFRPGRNTWLSMLFKPRIDKVLFAATKADHLHSSSHDRLEAILKLLTDRALARARQAGADVGALAIASVRATREAMVSVGGESLPCIAGIPEAGQSIDGRTFDGRTETAVFPGDLPRDPAQVLDRDSTFAQPGAASFVRFRPPLLRATATEPDGAVPPHIRLDRALEFLIGDWLA